MTRGTLLKKVRKQREQSRKVEQIKRNIIWSDYEFGEYWNSLSKEEQDALTKQWEEN